MSYIGRTPQIGAYHKLDSITCDGSTAYTMQLDSANFVPESVNHLIVSVNGVIQAPTDSFTVSSSTITFASALSSSDTIDFIMALGNVLDIGTPSDNTVSSSKIIDGAISSSKLATTSITGQTAETSANDSDSLLIYDDSATALRKMTRANFLTGVGGSNTPAFMVRKTPNQSVSGATSTLVTFNSEIVDSDGRFDTSTSRFTPTETGYYYLFAQVNIQAIHDQATTELDIKKNGSFIASRFKHIALNSSSDREPSIFTSCIIDVDDTAPDDYFEVFIYTDFGSGTTITGSSNPIYTSFGGFKLIGV